MDEHLPQPPSSFALKPPTAEAAARPLPPKDWPHAPVHRLSEHGIYFVTAGTLRKQHIFDTPAKRDLLERMLLCIAKKYVWQLEAWAVLANHYHFVARGAPDSLHLGDMLRELHSRSAIEVNRLDGTENRAVWFNFRDTRLTYQHAYLARLSYVHRNAVKHGLVPVANQYRWCSAAWFERTASAAQVKTIYRVKIDRVVVQDDF
jgi:putative transposase